VEGWEKKRVRGKFERGKLPELNERKGVVKGVGKKEKNSGSNCRSQNDRRETNRK